MAATIPYLCRTHCPTQAGRGQPKRPQAPPHTGNPTPHRRGGANQNDHRGGGDKARNDDITTNKWQQPYHTSVEHTAPHRRGGANQKDHRSHSTGGGGGDEAKQDQTGKATSPNKTTTHLTGKGGYHGEGGGRGGVACGSLWCGFPPAPPHCGCGRLPPPPLWFLVVWVPPCPSPLWLRSAAPPSMAIAGWASGVRLLRVWTLGCDTVPTCPELQSQ